MVGSRKKIWFNCRETQKCVCFSVYVPANENPLIKLYGYDWKTSSSCLFHNNSPFYFANWRSELRKVNDSNSNWISSVISRMESEESCVHFYYSAYYAKEKYAFLLSNIQLAVGHFCAALYCFFWRLPFLLQPISLLRFWLHWRNCNALETGYSGKVALNTHTHTCIGV